MIMIPLWIMKQDPWYANLIASNVILIAVFKETCGNGKFIFGLEIANL